MASKYSFWLLKPHQKPVSCQFEINEGTGVRLLRDAGGQLFKFTFEKIVKWNLGRDPNFLELQIQLGKTGPAGSLKFQVKDESTTEDIHNILDIITRNKGGDGGATGADNRKQAGSTHEKTNVARKKEAEEIKKSSTETMQKIKKERRQQSMRLQQANVTVTPSKQDSEEIQDKMIRHKKSIQAKRQERNRSFAMAGSKESAVSAKINASIAAASSPAEPSASDPPAVRERPARKKSSRASIYALASSTNYEEMDEIEEESSDQVPEMKQQETKVIPPPPKPRASSSSLSRGKKIVRQPSGIMPAPKVARPLSSLSAIGEAAEEKGVSETPTKRPPPPPPSAAQRRSVAKVAPPPPTSLSPRKSLAAASGQSQSKPPPPAPISASTTTSSGQPQPPKKLSLVEKRRSMYQQREEDSGANKGRSPSPSPLRRSPATSTDRTSTAGQDTGERNANMPTQGSKVTEEEPEPMQTEEEAKEAPSPAPQADAPPPKAPPAKRGSFMLANVDATSQPDLAEARSMINMLKMELQTQKDKAASSDNMLKEMTSEQEILKSKYNILANEKESYLEEIANLERNVEKQGSIQGESEEETSERMMQLLEEKENLSEENSNLLKAEALLLRTVMESSDMLGALSNRLWQVCEEEQPEDPQETTDDTDADMQALRKTISSLSKAMDAMETQKVQRDEEFGQIKSKVKRMQGHKQKMEKQIKEEGEVTSALMTEADTAAVEGEDALSMMEEFKAIAEKRSEELQVLGGEKEAVLSELASVTREYDLIKVNVNEAVEQAVAAERTRSVAHLKSELSKEKQKYEQMLEELLKDEEERSKQEESQAEAIERQVAETIANNETILKERMAELEAQYTSNNSGTDATDLAAKNAQLEKDLASANAKVEKMDQRVRSITSEIKFLSASTSSAYRAVESFVDNSTTFTSHTIEHLMSKGEAFALKTLEEVEVMYNKLNEEMDRVSAEVEIGWMSGGSIEMVPSSSEVSPVSSAKLSSGNAEADVPASTDDADADADASIKKARTATRTTSITGMVHMDIPEGLSEQFQVVQEPSPPSPSTRKKDNPPSPRRSVAQRNTTTTTATTAAGAPAGANTPQVDLMHLKEGEILLQKLDEIKELSSQQNRERGLQEQIGNMSADLQQAQADLEALGLQLKEAREDLSVSRRHAEDADNVRNVVEAQCRTLVLELAASRLNTTSQLLEEDFVGTKETESSGGNTGGGGDIVKGIQLSGDLASRLVVPVDILRQGMPTYTLLELTDHGMKLGESEVELSKKREDFPWNRINQITVGIAQDYVSLDMFEHANAEAVHVRIRDVRHLNTVLNVITKKRIEAALAYAPQMASIHDGIDFGLNVTKVYQDPGEVAVQAARALLQRNGVDLPAEQMENAEGKVSSMSPAVVRISSVSRGLARTHMNLKRRLLTEGLGHFNETSSEEKTKEPRFNLGVTGDVHENFAAKDEEEQMMEDLKLVEEETERERNMCSKIATLEAVRNDLVHKLASIRVSAVAAVMQAQNVVKYLATESRGEMAQELLKLDDQHELPEDPISNSPSKRNHVPTWKPVNEAVQNLLKESISWSANDLIDPTRAGMSKDGNFSFGMNEAEREAFLVAQAEAELTQSAVNCLEGLWKDRVAKLQGQLDLTQKKGDETQDHESKLLQDMASSRATIASLQDELTYANKELNTLKHVYETQESIEGGASASEDVPIALPDVQDVPDILQNARRLMAATPLALVVRGGSGSPSGNKNKSPTSTKTDKEQATESVVKAEKEGEPRKSPTTSSSNQEIILGRNLDQIQSRQQQVSNEIVDAVENLKFIDDRLTELDKASTFIGDRVESYFSNLNKMEESVLRHNSKLGQIEREIQEQDLKIAQVKASVIQTQQQQQQQEDSAGDSGKKSVTFATTTSPFAENNNNGNQQKRDQSPIQREVPYEMYFPIVATPEATPPPSTPKEKVSLSVKAKKLENVVQNIIEMIG